MLEAYDVKPALWSKRTDVVREFNLLLNEDVMVPSGTYSQEVSDAEAYSYKQL